MIDKNMHPQNENEIVKDLDKYRGAICIKSVEIGTAEEKCSRTVLLMNHKIKFRIKYTMH